MVIDWQFKLDQTSATPLHVQIRDRLAAMIRDGAVAAGEQLPTLRVLAESCGVALRTAAQAVELLQKDGLVISRRGRGVFVTERPEALCRHIVKVCVHPHFLTRRQGRVFETVAGIAEAALEHHVELRYVTSLEDLPASDTGPSMDGLLLFDSNFETDGFAPIVNAARERGVPICVLDDYRGDLPHVCLHRDHGVASAVELLAKNGHSRIAFINIDCTVNRSKDNAGTGYLRGLRQYGIAQAVKYYAEAVSPREYSEDEARQAILKFLDLDEPPTGLVCYGDEYAYIALECLAQRGLKAPEDLSVVGYGDAWQCRETTPSLTSVKPCGNAVGRAGMTYLIDVIQGRNPEPPSVYPELIARESVGPPRKESGPLVGMSHTNVLRQDGPVS
jgi:DNA-binding LacI/PurR family transcriptional regulator